MADLPEPHRIGNSNIVANWIIHEVTHEPMLRIGPIDKPMQGYRILPEEAASLVRYILSSLPKVVEV